MGSDVTDLTDKQLSEETHVQSGFTVYRQEVVNEGEKRQLRQTDTADTVSDATDETGFSFLTQGQWLTTFYDQMFYLG